MKKTVKDFDSFINENMIKIPMGEVRGSEIRVNAVGNKIYLVNFDTEIHPPEKKKFLQHIKEKYGSIITNITNHLGDMVIELSVYVNQPMATTFKDILNDIFTARAETNMEKSDREDTEKEAEGQ
jgi:3'-phosphoadenosine 5'-phosphosulfate sulfotransferase (PAPS reductase)/FAD synthetase